MASRPRRTGRRVKVGCWWPVLLGCVLVFLGGCEEGIARRPAVDSTGTIPSERTEAQLLADINRKFENPQAHYELARRYHTSQQWIKAEYHYNVALGFDPAHKAAQAGLIKMFTDRGDAAKAEQYANSYIRQASGIVTELLRLGWEFEKLDLDEYAARSFARALEMSPDSAEVNKQAGFYYLGRGDTARAKQYLLRSFELNPRQSDVAGALGRLGVVVETPPPPEMTMEKEQ